MLKLTIGAMNVTSLVEKEAKLVGEVERYWLDIVGFTSMHSKVVEAVFLKGVGLGCSVQGKRGRADLDLLIAPRLLSHCLPCRNFCASYSLSITNTMFSRKTVHECTWHQYALRRQSGIYFVVVSFDLRMYVLDSQVKRGPELSTDHQLGLSWIR